MRHATFTDKFTHQAVCFIHLTLLKVHNRHIL